MNWAETLLPRACLTLIFLSSCAFVPPTPTSAADTPPAQDSVLVADPPRRQAGADGADGADRPRQQSVLTRRPAAAAVRDPRPALPEVRPAPPTASDAEFAASNTLPGVLNGADLKVEKVLQRYEDGKVQVEREVTLDTTGNFINHGLWKWYSKDGRVASEGRFVMGKRIGPWKRWMWPETTAGLNESPFNAFTPPFVSEANFEDGQLDGTWTIADAKQRKVCQLNFAEGLRHGVSSWWFPSGKPMREVEYQQGVLHGTAREWNEAQKLVREAVFVDGQQLVSETKYFEGTKLKRSQERYLKAKLVVATRDDWWNCELAQYAPEGEDLRHGDWVAWYRDGKPRMQGKYVRGKLVGEAVWWFSNGQRKVVGYFADDVPTGRWQWWHKNGMKAAEGEYTNGSPTGSWLAWDETGRRLTETNWVPGSEPEDEQTVERTPTPASSDPPRVSRRPGGPVAATAPAVEATAEAETPGIMLEAARVDRRVSERRGLVDPNHVLTPAADAPAARAQVSVEAGENPADLAPAIRHAQNVRSPFPSPTPTASPSPADPTEASEPALDSRNGLRARLNLPGYRR